LESENENEFENLSVYSKRRVLSLNDDNVSRAFSQIDIQVLHYLIHKDTSEQIIIKCILKA
jgi:hypothetical protein